MSSSRPEPEATSASTDQPQAYLFDTSCFMSLAFKQVHQTALRMLSGSVNACALTALELVADHPNFTRRKRAAQAIASVCRSVYCETTESIIKAAFGMPQPAKPSFDAFGILRALLLADSSAAMERGVYDPEYNCVRTVRPKEIRRIKTTRDRQDREMFSGWANATRAHVRDYVAEHESNLEGDTRSKRVLELKGKYSLMPQVALAVLLRLATLAGVCTTDEVARKVEADDTSGLIRQVAAVYDGSLDCFITMFQAYRRFLELGGAPTRNDTFDLEFFLYLDAGGRRLTFVTKERKWIDLANEVMPGRVVHLEALVGAA